MSDTIPMTTTGHKAIEEELNQLKKVERPAVIQAIAEAREHGDLKENAEYHAAREQQSFIEGRIQELEDKIARAHVVDPATIKSDKIVFGATVTLENQDSGEKTIYKIVGTDEADVKQGRISIESPIARQLINKQEGDEITIRVPKGDRDYEIIDVEYR